MAYCILFVIICEDNPYRKWTWLQNEFSIWFFIVTSFATAFWDVYKVKNATNAFLFLLFPAFASFCIVLQIGSESLMKLEIFYQFFKKKVAWHGKRFLSSSYDQIWQFGERKNKLFVSCTNVIYKFFVVPNMLWICFWKYIQFDFLSVFAFGCDGFGFFGVFSGVFILLFWYKRSGFFILFQVCFEGFLAKIWGEN